MDTAIEYEVMMEANASAEFGGNCTRKKHKHRSWLAHSGSDNEVLHGQWSKGVWSLGLEAEDTRAIWGDVPMMIARDSLDPRVRPSTVDRLYEGKSSERWTAGEQQLNWTWSSNCGCKEGKLQVVTPRSFPSSHSDEASMDTCAPRGDVPTTAAQDSLLDPRVCLAKVDRLSMNPNKTKHLLPESWMLHVSKSWYIFGWILFAWLLPLCFGKMSVDWGKAFTVVALMTGFSKKIGSYPISWEPLHCMQHPEKHGFRAISRKG
jgi:hypothetical protein